MDEGREGPVVQLARKLLGTPEEQAQRRARRQAEAEKAERDVLTEEVHAQLCVEQGAQHEGWELPVPFNEFDLPAFPLDALPDGLRAFVEAEATATQTPPDLPAMLALAACAAASAKKAEIQVKDGYIEPLNIFTVVAIPPANRKSAVFKDVTAPLEEFEAEESRRLAPEIAEAQTHYKIAAQALKNAEDKAAKAKPEEKDETARKAAELARELASMKVPVFPREIVDDCTSERLPTLLRDHGGRIAAMSPEGDLFDIMAGRYSANGMPNIGVYLKGHAGDDLRVDRVGRAPDFVKAPALTLALAVQPDVLRGLMEKPGFRGRGLLARPLYSLPRSTLGRRDTNALPMPPGVRAAYGQRVQALLRLTPATNAEGESEAHRLRLSPEAQSLFRQFEAVVEPMLAEGGVFGSMTDWGGKLVGAVARIAGILHMVEHAFAPAPWEIPVSFETVERAMLIGDYLKEHAKAAYAEMGANPEIDAAQHILRWILRKGSDSCSKRDAFQGTKGRFRQVKAMEPGLKLLEEHGYIRPKAEPGLPQRGRPSRHFDVNPLAQPSQNTQTSPASSLSEVSGNIGSGEVARG